MTIESIIFGCLKILIRDKLIYSTFLTSISKGALAMPKESYVFYP